MKRILTAVFLAACIASYAGVNRAGACTYFFLKAQDGSVVSARSDEFYSEAQSKIALVPRGVSYTTRSYPKGAKPLSWKTKYGFVAISMFDRDVYGEGMNEKGLAIGGLWFADMVHPQINPGDTVVETYDVFCWVLGSFENVQEVKDAFQKIKVYGSADNPFQMIIPTHYYVTDAAGNSIVIEYIGGKLKIWDNNANGVMTNEPDLGWHLTNLRNYSHMNPTTPFNPALGGEELAQGSGLLGLPGDYSCASRFAKISVLKRFSDQPKDADGAVTLAEHLINTVDIPYGPVVWISGNQKFTQWTIWTTFYDHTHKYFYYRTYDNPVLRRIDYSKLDFKEGAPKKRIDIFGGKSYVDETDQLASPGANLSVK